MTKQAKIEDIVNRAYHPEHLRVINDSSKHRMPGDETHFTILVVSDRFLAMKTLQRHRLVLTDLGDIAKQTHSLSFRTFTPEEWKQGNGVMEPSPTCRSGKTTP